MLFKDIIYLVTTTYAMNSYGDSTETLVEKKVFADKKAIRYGEFYQANAQGIKPEITFIVRASEYTNQVKIKYNNKYYNVIRVYNDGVDFVELTVEGIIGQEVRT